MLPRRRAGRRSLEDALEDAGESAADDDAIDAEAGVLMEATAVFDKLTDGWTQYGDTCEYKMDDAVGVTLRPLGGGASAELNSFGFGGRTNLTSFKIEGAIMSGSA